MDKSVELDALILDCFATGSSIEVVESLTGASPEYLRQFKEEKALAIRLRAQQLDRQIGIINPTKRLRALNRITRMGIRGVKTVDQKGGVSYQKNLPAAIQAIKVVNEMLGEKSLSSSSNTDERAERQQLILDFFRGVQETASLTDAEAWGIVENELPEWKQEIKLLKGRKAGE